MRAVRAWILCVTAGLSASLLLARVHPFGDAGLFGGRTAAVAPPLLGRGQVPEPVRAMLIEKCADCHSEQTRVPLYGRFAPASWLMERDLVEARKAMNLSQWEGYSADRRQILAAKILQQTRSRQMPLPQYRLIHWNARVTDADVVTLTNWARSFGQQGAEPLVSTAVGGDANRGKALFEKRCTGCHALNRNLEGPALQGVYGRTSGTAAGFAYSGAVKKAGIVWNETSLDKWLTDPDAFIAGNDMDFSVANARDRLDVITYLRHTSGK